MILDEIITNKRQHLPKKGVFKEMFDGRRTELICELKLKSPTHPAAFTDNYQSVLDDYARADVKVMSVVTDRKYFGGDLAMVTTARQRGFVVLRKDFVVNPSQIAEVYADAILLIARIVTPKNLAHLVDVCLEVGIEPVVEVHSQEELAAAQATNASVIAVNTRDLDKQRIDFAKGLQLLEQIDGKYTKLLFSGVNSRIQINRANQSGANGVLIGTSVLAASNRITKIKELQG